MKTRHKAEMRMRCAELISKHYSVRDTTGLQAATEYLYNYIIYGLEDKKAEEPHNSEPAPPPEASGNVYHDTVPNNPPNYDTTTSASTYISSFPAFRNSTEEGLPIPDFLKKAGPITEDKEDQKTCQKSKTKFQTLIARIKIFR